MEVRLRESLSNASLVSRDFDVDETFDIIRYLNPLFPTLEGESRISLDGAQPARRRVEVCYPS